MNNIKTYSGGIKAIGCARGSKLNSSSGSYDAKVGGMRDITASITLTNADSANNIIGENALIPGYPASQQGQLDYLND
mgnify:CR=1 FL=1